MSGFHKLLHVHETILYHQADRIDGHVVGEFWMLDGVSKKRGMEAGLQNVGWSWLRGHVGGGIWETSDKRQVELCVERKVKVIEVLS